ncbi:MAG: divalent-cation tolerance protein CutA [Candidatus Aminicenantes bacterium]|nr:divalent-cation tolerance protein CutA [Candidatus Aminicenantes bacterium]
MSEYVQIITTTDSRAAAAKIAVTLVKEKLAACVQVSGPISSTYEWKGKIEQAEEWVCAVKTRKDLYPRVEGRIKALHTYETPEIIALPITAGNPAYLAWIDEVTGNK